MNITLRSLASGGSATGSGAQAAGSAASDEELPELAAVREQLERASAEYVQLELATHFPALLAFVREAESALERNETHTLAALEGMPTTRTIYVYTRVITKVSCNFKFLGIQVTDF